MTEAGQIVFSRMQRVVWGRPAAEVVAEEAGRLGAQRVFLIVSRTLNRTTDVVSEIGRGLGNRVAGLFEGIPAHVHRATVIAATRDARAAKADLIVTVGGSSASGVGKMARLALALSWTAASVGRCGRQPGERSSITRNARCASA